MNRCLPLGKEMQGLYYTTFHNTPSKHCNSSIPHTLARVTTTKDTLEMAKLWHIRLGHAPFKRLKILFPNLDLTIIKNSFFVLFVLPLDNQDYLSPLVLLQ